MKFKLINVLAIAGILLAVSSVAFSKGKGVPYSEGYRRWRHVKSMLIQPGHTLTDPFQGIRQQEGTKMPANWQIRRWRGLGVRLFNYVEKEKAITEGERKLVGVLHKNAIKYAETGCWGFEGFGGNNKTEQLMEGRRGLFFLSCF